MPAAVDAFFGTLRLIKVYEQHAEEIWTARLLPAQAHGSLVARQPFSSSYRCIPARRCACGRPDAGGDSLEPVAGVLERRPGGEPCA